MTDATTTRRWGRAGVRLADAQIEANDLRHRAQAIQSRSAAEAAHRNAHDDWRAGRVVPWRITMALDAHRLYGPQVDEACGVAEPTVDMWEAGLIYPSWEQLCALAKLTLVTPGMFMRRDDRALWLRASDTSMRFHTSDVEEREPVLSFTPEAIAVTLDGQAVCPTCRRSR